MVEVTGSRGGECHLLFSEGAVVLVESGCGFCAAQAVENIRRELDGRKLDAILLTHSHFDHAGGSPLIARSFPEAEVVASGHAASIFAKEKAQKFIAGMDSAAAQRAGVEDYEDLAHKLHVDRVVEDGDVVQVGDMTLRVLSAPGHTRCAVCYYWEQAELLISCETLGICATYPEIVYCYVISYDMTQETIEKMRKLNPRHIFVPHYGMIPDEGCARYFDDCAAAACAVKDLIVEGCKAGHDLEQITANCKKTFYDGKVDVIQPLGAFIANTHVMIPRTLAEFGLELAE